MNRISRLSRRSLAGVAWLVAVVAGASYGRAKGDNSAPVAPMKGQITTADGTGIGGVAVEGSVWQSCCPAKADRTKSNEKGEFVLEHGGVVHFSRAGRRDRRRVPPHFV